MGESPPTGTTTGAFQRARPQPSIVSSPRLIQIVFSSVY